MQYGSANVMSCLLPICDAMLKILVISMAFVFALAPTGTLINPLAAFSFTFGHMEASQSASMHFHFVIFPFAYCKPHTTYMQC